jgi:uncharacterized protein YbjT (DUF2867 family)
MRSIGVFPASGALASATITHLLRLLPADGPTQLILISRHPEKVSAAHRLEDLQQSKPNVTVQLRQASYESSPSDLGNAFAGVNVLFLISYPSHVHEYRVRVQLPALDAAVKAGVQHVFYSSLGFAGTVDARTSKAVVMQAHLDTEAQLRHLAETSDDKFSFTSVREGLYAESFPIYTAFFDLKQPSDEVCIPHDGTGPGIAWVARDELGEGTAKLILDYVKDPEGFRWTNGVVLLTGQRAWTLGETADLLGKLAGRRVRIRQVSVEDYAALPKVIGVFGGAEKARSWATAWDAIRAGETAVVTPDLRDLLGREPAPFDEIIGRMAKT